MSSRLERALLTAIPAMTNCEWEMDILRDVLTRRAGTDAQRNALLRIIDQNKPRKPVLPRILKQLGELVQSRSTYSNIPPPQDTRF